MRTLFSSWRSEELMLLHGVSEPVVTLIVLILLDPLFEPPVVGKNELLLHVEQGMTSGCCWGPVHTCRLC